MSSEIEIKKEMHIGYNMYICKRYSYHGHHRVSKHFSWRRDALYFLRESDQLSCCPVVNQVRWTYCYIYMICINVCAFCVRIYYMICKGNTRNKFVQIIITATFYFPAISYSLFTSIK